MIPIELRLVRSLVAALALAGLVAACGQDGSGAEPIPACHQVPLPPQTAPPEGLDRPLVDQDFENSNTGTLAVSALDEDWNEPLWENGVADGRVTVSDDDGGRFLRVRYPEGKIGSGESGAQWQALFEPVEAAHLSYWVRFDQDFDFVRGGKLPGLAGGEANTGGDIPDGTDGWSARVVWERAGCAAFYVYHADMPGQWGEHVRWAAAFEPGRWHRIDQIVVMNTPGENDGLIQGWLDGHLVLEREGFRFRDVADFSIDVLYFSTFFGGGDDSFAPGSDQTIEFDNFLVVRTPGL